MSLTNLDKTKRYTDCDGDIWEYRHGVWGIRIARGFNDRSGEWEDIPNPRWQAFDEPDRSYSPYTELES